MNPSNKKTNFCLFKKKKKKVRRDMESKNLSLCPKVIDSWGMHTVNLLDNLFEFSLQLCETSIHPFVDRLLGKAMAVWRMNLLSICLGTGLVDRRCRQRPLECFGIVCSPRELLSLENNNLVRTVVPTYNANGWYNDYVHKTFDFRDPPAKRPEVKVGCRGWRGNHFQYLS